MNDDAPGHRHLDLVIDGLRIGGERFHPLSGPALTLEAQKAAQVSRLPEWSHQHPPRKSRAVRDVTYWKQCHPFHWMQ